MDEDGNPQKGCADHVDLIVLLYPGMSFEEACEKYNDDMDYSFRKRVDEAMARYLFGKEQRVKSQPIAPKSIDDVTKSHSYGYLLDVSSRAGWAWAGLRFPLHDPQMFL